MYSGISGLYTNGEAMSTIGNNIANINTVGFKQGRALFSDLLSTTIKGGQVGHGAQIQKMGNLFSQGTFDTTENETDLAIQGDSFFVLQDAGGVQRYYTRAGAFTFDHDNTLCNPDGYQVLGFGIANGVANGVLAPIDLSGFSVQAPKASANFSCVLNLDSTDTVPTGVWDPTLATFDPMAASNFSTSTTVYDGPGQPLPHDRLLRQDRRQLLGHLYL
jgi:flagellar hook protein FlgE